MSDYNWCHGPNCHTNHTQSRIRGSGDNKVLRTIRIKGMKNKRVKTKAEKIAERLLYEQQQSVN